MRNGAKLKVDRAARGIDQLKALFSENKPFTYVIETNTQTCERATFAKKNNEVIDEASLLSGEIIHNLRCSLDHAYWEIVSPLATEKGQQKQVQFPFCESDKNLEQRLKKRLAHKVSPRFFGALVDLRPYGGESGNEFLYLVDQLDILDKHKLLIPTADYKRMSGQNLREQIPDFPNNFELHGVAFSNGHRDLIWETPRQLLERIDLGSLKPLTTHRFEKNLDIPVEIVFAFEKSRPSQPVISALEAMLEATCDALEKMYAAVS